MACIATPNSIILCHILILNICKVLCCNSVFSAPTSSQASESRFWVKVGAYLAFYPVVKQEPRIVLRSMPIFFHAIYSFMIWFLYKPIDIHQFLLKLPCCFFFFKLSSVMCRFHYKMFCWISLCWIVFLENFSKDPFDLSEQISQNFVCYLLK